MYDQALQRAYNQKNRALLLLLHMNASSSRFMRLKEPHLKHIKAEAQA